MYEWQGRNTRLIINTEEKGVVYLEWDKVVEDQQRLDVSDFQTLMSQPEDGYSLTALASLYEKIWIAS